MNSIAKNNATAPTPSMIPFFALWGGQVFSMLGSQLAQFSMVWWLTQSTGSATVLAFATMMAMLPQVFIGPIAGTLVDRWNRRTVMMVADGSVSVAALILAAIFAVGRVEVAFIYALIFYRASAVAFHWPSMQASIPLLVPDKHLSRIAGMNHTLFGLATIIAPPVGALLVSVLPMHGILMINAAASLIAVLPLVFIRIPSPTVDQGAGEGVRPSVLAGLKEGLDFLKGWPALLMMVGTGTLLNLLLMPGISLQPLLITRHFHGGATEFAWLQSAFGVGMVLGGVALGAWGGFKRRMLTSVLALFLAGMGIAVVGVAPENGLPLAVGAMFFSGLMFPIMNGAMVAVLQSIIPSGIQGRVFSLVMSGSAAAAPVGLAIAGPVADAVSVQVWFIVAGIAMSVLGVLIFCTPAIMEIEERPRPALSLWNSRQRVASE